MSSTVGACWSSQASAISSWRCTQPMGRCLDRRRTENWLLAIEGGAQRERMGQRECRPTAGVQSDILSGSISQVVRILHAGDVYP